jgi:hypothetical protein
MTRQAVTGIILPRKRTLAEIAGFGGQLGDLPLPWTGDNDPPILLENHEERFIIFSRLD